MQIGSLTFALPDWPERGLQNDVAAGHLERADGRGDDALVAWDVDPRAGAPSAEEARLDGTPLPPASVNGHAAVVLRTPSGTAVAWRCERTSRLIRVSSSGRGSPDARELAGHVSCHGGRPAAGGEVPTLSRADAAAAPFRFGNRTRASVSYVSKGALLTFFAGQQLAPPPDVATALREAPAWARAAGIEAASAAAGEPVPGPQGHPALRVRGTGRLQGRPVRYTMIFWRCLQRQRSYVALVFAEPREGEGDFTGSDGALEAARCHG